MLTGSPGGENAPAPWRAWRARALVFALAFMARLAFQSGVVGLDAPPTDDAVLYDSVATSLSNGGPYIDLEGYRSRRAPAFPVLLAGLYAVVGHSWPAARVMQAILSSITCVLLLEIGGALFGAGVGRAAALVCALSPWTVFWSGSLLTEPLCALLTTASTWALLHARNDARSAALWSALCALTALTRPNMALLFPLGLIGVLQSRRGRRLRLAIAIPVFILTLLPWTARNFLVHGRLVPITTLGGVTLWLGNNPTVVAHPELAYLPAHMRDERVHLPELEQDRLLLQDALRFMNESTGEMPALVLRKVRRLWNPFPALDNARQRWLATLTLLPILAGFAGALAIAWWRREARILPLLIPACAVTVTAAVYHGDGRIRSPADPLIILVACWGWQALLFKLVELGSKITR